ncbi:hypothetical protein MBLNU459_g2968t2 [Dothideomycetes sp. NU459]
MSSRKRAHSSGDRDTGNKSRYWKDENDGALDEQSTSPNSSSADEDSDFKGDPDVGSALDSDSKSGTVDETSDEEQPKRKQKRAQKNLSLTASSKAKQGNELWRQNVRTGLAPGTQLVIKKPKARAAGKTPYQDGSIHPNTLLFLGDLKSNNDREWLKMHDADYRTSLKDWDTLVETLTGELVKIDDTIPELPTKDIVFRIYRDIRFSKDPTPYKPVQYTVAEPWSYPPLCRHRLPVAETRICIDVIDGFMAFGAFPEEEIKSWETVLNLQGSYGSERESNTSGTSGPGSGLWNPEAQALAALRNDIDRNPQRLKSVLLNDRMREEFLGGVPSKEKNVVKAFIETPMNAESALKTKPKVACLNRIVLPDPGEEDEADEDDEEDEDEESGSETEM